MQKDPQNRGQTHYNPQTNQQMIYQQQIPNQAPMIQGTLPHMYTSQPQQLRATAPMNMNTGRMHQFAGAQPFIPNAAYAPNQRNDGIQSYQSYPMQQQYNMNAGSSPYQYQQVGYQPANTRNYQPIVYIPAAGAYGSNVIMQPQMSTNSVPHMTSQPQVVYNQNPMPSSQHSQAQIHQPIQPDQMNQTKKRSAIKITNPNTGKDVTNEVLKKKPEKTTTPSSGYSSASSTPPLQQQKEEEKAKIQAAFAAQVAAVASVPSPPLETTKATAESKKSEDKTIDSVKPASLSDETVKKTPSQQEEMPVETSTTLVTNDKQVETLKTEVEPDKVEEVSPVKEAATEVPKQTVAEVEPLEIKEVKIEEPKELPVQREPVVEEAVVIETEEVVESLPEDVDVIKETDPVTNGHVETDNSGLAFAVAKKKKGKNRFKDKGNNNDMLSAFTDEPVEEPTPKEPEPPKVPEKSPEDATWEDKETTIEKEDIRSADAEEPEIVPKITETKILKSEDTPITSEEEKLQYDRDFLLKFQFAPICTSKPAGLPDIDIVLAQAHPPTKALVPGSRISSANDFMPNFMRQASGGRSSGGGKSRSGRGSAGPGSRPQKVIQLPSFEKVELKKSENAWVRPSEKAKELPEEERIMNELERNVLSILNKLTPQKFKTLVDKMLQLKIDNDDKLSKAIELIFEKAVTEPGFSVAYANMCRVLTDNFKTPTKLGDKSTSTAQFRKVLLNKCQKEFEKESSDEKLLEEDRQKSFATEEEKKIYMEELDYRELTNRRRMLGNIRFIGELFKLKMISENIMHDCILKLLRAEKQDSLEDQLECLCKLLSTIGKDLDHMKAKPRMDQYFHQIQKIIEKRKISSRIKFALKDVIDLRRCGWVPRRDDSNPKTIDQIHKEAQQKEKEQEYYRQQDKLQRRHEPRNVGGRAGGGRDSPSVRGNQQQGSDGWTNVPSKARSQIASAPVDASKFKIHKKTDASEISLGPGGRAGTWSRGASGGGSRSGSGSNTPTSELDQRPSNRFDALSESNVTPGSLDGRRGRGAPLRKGASAGGRGRDDRSAALRAVKDMTTGSGRSSRNQSPARSSPSDISSAPSSGTQTPVEKSLSPVPISDEKMRKTTKSTIEEYFSTNDTKEVTLCIKELNAPELNPVFIEESIALVLEKKPEHRAMVGALLHDMMRNSDLTVDHMCKGLTSIMEIAQDLACDVPLIYKYLGEVIGPMVYDGTLPLNKVKDTLEPLVSLNKAGLVMAEALSIAVKISGKEEFICELWSQANITWNMLLNNDKNVEEFVKDKKMEFTMHTFTQAPQLSHASQVQDELRKILAENKEDTNNRILTLLKTVSSEERVSKEFIRNLTTSVCHSTIKDGTAKGCQCNINLLKERSKILLFSVDGRKDLELHVVYALQQLVHDLNHPRELLRVFFEELYQSDIISEGTFNTWESSKEFPEGKGPALSSVNQFLQWLKNADEEPNEDETVSQTSTNVV